MTGGKHNQSAVSKLIEVCAMQAGAKRLLPTFSRKVDVNI